MIVLFLLLVGFDRGLTIVCGRCKPRKVRTTIIMGKEQGELKGDLVSLLADQWHACNASEQEQEPVLVIVYVCILVHSLLLTERFVILWSI